MASLRRARARTAAIAVVLVGTAGVGSPEAMAHTISAPTITYAVPADGSIYVRWRAGDQAGADSYVATTSPGGATCAPESYQPGECTIADLTDGIPYSVTVTATADDGTTLVSQPSRLLTPMLDHTAPVVDDISVSPSVLPVGGGTVTVSVHITDVGSGLDDGQAKVWLEREKGVGVVPVPPVVLTRTSGDANDGIYQGVLSTPPPVAGADYWSDPNGRWWVDLGSPADMMGNAPSEVFAPQQLLVGVPAPPTAVVATQQGRSVHVSWNPPVSDGGSPIVRYLVQSTTAGWWDPVFSQGVDGAATSVDLPLPDGLSPRDSAFTVTAISAIDASDPVTSSVITLAAAPPDAPVVHAGVVNGRISVGIDAPPHVNGSPVSSYTATLDPDGSTCVLNAPGGCGFDTTNGVSYSVHVTATNAAGTSPAVTVSGLTPFGAPTAPSQVHLVRVGATSLRVTWTPGKGDGRPIDSSQVTLTPSHGPALYGGAAGSGGSTMFISGRPGERGGLAPNVTYTASVTTRSGPLSSTPVVAPERLSVPDGHKLAPRMQRPTIGSITSTAVTVHWRGVSVPGGLPVTGYLVRIWDGTKLVRAEAISPRARSDREDSLPWGTHYFARVYAINPAGYSPQSDATRFRLAPR